MKGVFSGFLFSLIAVLDALTVSLSQAEELAIRNNKHVCEIEALYFAAKEGRLEAYSQWFPQLAFTTQSYFTELLQPQTNTHSGYLSQLGVTQEIFSSDLYYGVKLSTLMEERLKILLEAAKNDILFATRTAYYQVVLEAETVATRLTHVDLLTSLSRRSRDNYTRGTTTIYHVNQSKVAAANATARFYDAKKRLKIAQDRLVKVLGMNPGSEEVLPEKGIPVAEIPEIEVKLQTIEKIFTGMDAVGELLYDHPFPAKELELMQDILSVGEMQFWEECALAQSPLLLDRRNDVAVAQTKVKQAIGEYIPSLEFAANYGGMNTPYFFSPSPHFGDMQFQWSCNLTFNWTLFDGLGRERRIKKARHESQAKSFGLEYAIQETLAQVRAQLFAIEEAVSSYATALGQVKLTSQAIEQAEEELGIGMITIFDYQIAVDNYIEAQNIKNHSRYALITSYYGLRHVSGIDVEH